MVRHFRDSAGVEWCVLQTEPQPNQGSRQRFPEEFRGGWLVFESANEKRRLAPFPSDWPALADRELLQLLTQAQPVAARSPAKSSIAQPAPSFDSGAAAPAGLRPQLREVQTHLEVTLDQVCSAPSVEQLNTGELIRVEETLAIAARAAKEAVSLRRKLGESWDQETRG
jgi:hypothetical protein